MSEWISVEDELPKEPKKHVQLFVDVWVFGGRITDVNYFDGGFHEIISDHQGDFSYYKKIKDVIAWMIVKNYQ